MKPLSPESRALLESARGREGPSAADRKRVRGKIAARVGAGLAFGSAVTASAAVAEAAHVTGLATVAAWLPAAAKVLSVVALAGGVTVGAVRVSQRASHPVPHAAAITGSPMRTVEAGNKPTPPIANPVSVQSPPAAVETQPEPSVGVAPKAPPAAKREAPSSVQNQAESSPVDEPRQPSDDGLNGQIAAIRDARGAVRHGDGAGALAALNRAFVPGQSGPLAQEATLVRVSAFCLLGDVGAARRTAEQFLASYPASPLATRIRSTCAFE